MAGYNDSVKSANVITGILSNATLQGDSAYEVAVKNGFVGTEAEWLASLKGDQGDQGIQGPIGPTGPTGATGNGISTIDMGSSGWMSIHTTDGTDYSFYVKGDKGNKGDTGVGISTVLLNSDYTLTITLTDGDTYTTDPIRGAKGETGTGITDVELNSDYTLTITMSDGTSYTTGSIRGAKGDKGDTGSKGDKGTSIRSVTKTGTSGLVDTYTITYDDNTTSTFTVTNGQNATVEVTSDTDSDYRLTFTDVNGSIETPNLYSDVTASAKQLLSDSYTLDQVPYLFRKSPDSDRAVEEIVGGTVGWNQLVYELTADNWLSENGVTASFDNGVATISSTVASNGIFMKDVFSAVKHKYLIMANVKGASGLDARVSVSSAQIGMTKVLSGSGWESLSTIRDNTIEISNRLYIYGYGQTYSDLQVKNVIITDLTTMFGSTIADYIYSLEQSTAGAGVAKLKEWGFFTEDYYEYCEPTLKSVEGLVSKKTVGFNQWDEISESGYYDISTGGKASGGTWKRNTNPIHVVPNTEYYFKATVPSSGSFGAILFYDGDNNLISYITNSANAINTIFTTPNNCHYMTFYTHPNWFSDDICINLSNPTRNGQYEPYENHSYPLDSTLTLRGIPKLDSNNNLYYDGDIYPADGQGKRRYGVVDLGSLNYYKDSDTVFYAPVPNTLGNYATNGNTEICSKYISNTSAVSWPDKSCRFGTTSMNINICDSDFSGKTASEVKALLSGVYLVYKLATPTTFTAQPYHNPQIVGDTEEFVTTGIVPVGHATKYFLDLRSRIEGLPDDFSTLIAPTEITNKATKNYTKGELLILNNQLYKVTSAIANNGTITVNTNVRATTIAQEISPLVPPTTNGTYVLKATVSNGNVTYSWVAG